MDYLRAACEELPQANITRESSMTRSAHNPTAIPDRTGTTPVGGPSYIDLSLPLVRRWRYENQPAERKPICHLVAEKRINLSLPDLPKKRNIRGILFGEPKILNQLTQSLASKSIERKVVRTCQPAGTMILKLRSVRPSDRCWIRRGNFRPAASRNCPIGLDFRPRIVTL